MKIKHVYCFINGVQMSGTPTRILKALDGKALEAFRQVLTDLQKDMDSGRFEAAGISTVYQGIDISVTAS